MPTTEWLFPDRMAAARTRYQIRQLKKSLVGLPPERLELAMGALARFLRELDSSVDLDDEGKVISDGPNPDLLEIRDLRPSWAKDLADGYMCLGAALPTRDGRRTGNATLVSVNPDGTAKVLTDAGNRMVLTHNELEELFYEPVWTMDPNNAPGYAGDLKL